MKISSMYTNYYRHNNNNHMLNDSYIPLPKIINCDTFTFMSDSISKKVPLYFQINGKQYKPKTQSELAFNESITSILRLNGNVDVENEKEALNGLNRAYEDVSIQIQDDEKNNIDTIIYVFCSLLECLDGSKSIQVSKDINYYLFENFIPEYENVEALRDFIRKITSADVLNKKVLNVRLQNLINRNNV